MTTEAPTAVQHDGGGKQQYGSTRDSTNDSAGWTSTATDERTAAARPPTAAATPLALAPPSAARAGSALRVSASDPLGTGSPHCFRTELLVRLLACCWDRCSSSNRATAQVPCRSFQRPPLLARHTAASRCTAHQYTAPHPHPLDASVHCSRGLLVGARSAAAAGAAASGGGGEEQQSPGAGRGRASPRSACCMPPSFPPADHFCCVC